MLDATFLLRCYAIRRGRRLARMDPAATQQRVLRRLIRQAKHTKFGSDHGFSDISKVSDFIARVPLRTYEEFRAEYWEADFPRLTDISWPGTVPYFAVTSGTTTGRTKYIPITREMINSNTKAGLDVLVHHVANRPASRIMAGQSFVLGGSTDLAPLADGIEAGDLSGIAAANVRWWARSRYFPPLDLALLSDWEEKIALLSKRALTADIRSVSGTPSWLLTLFDRMAEIGGYTDYTLHDLFPALDLVIHGGVNFAPYQSRFDALMEGSKAELREVYPASEGFFASADAAPEDGLRLNLDHGIFYEFIPVDRLHTPNPPRHWIGTVEPNVNYAIAVSTCAGLWSYLVGDTIRFISTRPHRLKVTGRTSYMLSAFGEHLIGEEIEEAVSSAARKHRLIIRDYAAGSLFPEKPGDLGGHLYVIEFTGPIPKPLALNALGASIDTHLCATNEDYEQHRAGGFGLNAPKVLVAPPGTFEDWMKARGQLGGQHKVPRIINDSELFESLRALAGKGAP